MTEDLLMLSSYKYRSGFMLHIPHLKMTLESYFLVPLIFLSQLVLHSADQESYRGPCPPFRCGELGEVGFPFSNTTNPECGLCVMDCTVPEPKVQFYDKGKWYHVVRMRYKNETIEIHGQDDVQSDLESDLRNKVSPFLNINVTTPLVKCKHGSPVSPSVFFDKFDKPIRCKGYDLYLFDDDEDRSVPSLPESLPTCCSFLPRPPRSVQSHELCMATENPAAWDGYFFTIHWKVWSNCTECHHNMKGGRCLNKPDRTFKCGNLKKGGSVTRKIGISIGGTVTRKIGITIALSAVGGLFVILMLVCWWKRVQLSTHSIVFLKREEKTQRVVEDFLKNYGTLAPKRYTYHDIKKITSSFKDKVGQGGYGVVYKGKLVDGRLVAVKLLDKAKGNGEEFMNEVASISRTSHVNVVSLLGFCFDGSQRALIYEFVPKGSLEKFIYDQNQLKALPRLEWRTLYQISIGVARGLEYLHRGCSTRILHFDIKPHNILLDKDFTPKISDFGLAKICSRDESIISMLDARGTAGYIAPEVFCRNIGGVSHKSDVYSYGMMVLEIVGRRRNIDVGVDRTSEIYFPHWIYKRLELNEDLGLHGVMSKEDEEITRKMLLVSLWCIQTSPIDRPTMTKVVEMLEGRLELLSTPPKPYLCSPARDPVSSSNT